MSKLVQENNVSKIEDMIKAYNSKNYFKLDITPKFVHVTPNSSREGSVFISVVFYNENVCNTKIVNAINSSRTYKEVYKLNYCNDGTYELYRFTKVSSKYVSALDLIMGTFQGADLSISYKGETSDATK